MNINEQKYLDLLSKVQKEGEEIIDRTGVGTLSIFGTQTHYNLSDGFPPLTTKRMYWKGIVHELLWMISGGTNIKFLQDNSVHIWDKWADEEGNLGPVYGEQWRKWATSNSGETIDQLRQVIKAIKEDPFSRRLIVSAWNVGELSKMALPPCHMMFQFKVHPDKTLDLLMSQRSADMFLGVPFNIAFYSLLLLMVSQVTGCKPGTFIHTTGDTHIYSNHTHLVSEQLKRPAFPPPYVVLDRDVTDIEDFRYTKIHLEGYTSHPAIKGPVAV